MDAEHKHKMTSPPPELGEWIDLAIKYEEAGLGNAMTEQTRFVLMSVKTFLVQPSQTYCPCLWAALGDTPPRGYDLTDDEAAEVLRASFGEPPQPETPA